MRLSRREFVGCAAAATGGLSILGMSGWGATSFGTAPGAEQVSCAILDLGPDCALRESLRGYQVALGCRVISPSIGEQDLQNRRLLIVPGAGTLRMDIARLLMDRLDAGALVVLESGCGFSGRAEVAEHRNCLQRFFGIIVGDPVDLWQERRTVPYVQFEWPHKVLVRDFSRALPVTGQPGETIGKVGSIPIALTKRISKGLIAFLGSPIGPALGAGDAESLAWLRALTRV